MSEAYDVLVIGGGIVGAGVAREAAMRGLRVFLAEQADFASGTSSRSSRLLHGGIRYLAQGRVGLVREASVEKLIISRIAPHLSSPLPFLFPTRRGTAWSKWKLSAGVRIYDLLCGGRNLGRSSTLSPAEMLRELPALSPDGLTGGVRYFDGFTNDARLVLDTLQSAVANGAEIANYTRILDAERRGDVWSCNAGTRIIPARTVVNAAGAWAEGMPNSRVRLRLTKGVHLVVSRERVPVREAVVVAEGNRILFVIPWGERVILGTTDTDYPGDPAAVSADVADMVYILDAINSAFPGWSLAPADVISTWVGVRPLVAPRHAATDAPSDISRNHEIHTTAPGWFEVTGGKLTTYRLMAEQAVDRIADVVPAARVKSRTASEPLLQSAPRWSALTPPPVDPQTVEAICTHEWPQHLDDVMMRRTSWHFYHGFREVMANNVASWMQGPLGWSDKERDGEIARYRQVLERESPATFRSAPPVR